jgi:hypothetical protein
LRVGDYDAPARSYEGNGRHHGHHSALRAIRPIETSIVHDVFSLLVSWKGSPKSWIDGPLSKGRIVRLQLITFLLFD